MLSVGGCPVTVDDVARYGLVVDNASGVVPKLCEKIADLCELDDECDSLEEQIDDIRCVANQLGNELDELVESYVDEHCIDEEVAMSLVCAVVKLYEKNINDIIGDEL